MSVRVVAELGQCHQGSAELARDMIRRVARPIDPYHWEEMPELKADAVKVQIRDLDRELSGAESSRRYDDPDRSFAHETQTYGEHRERLELSMADHRDLRDYAHEHGLKFVVTACQRSVVKALPFMPDAWKVASRDLTNLPLIEAMAKTGLPVILSTGMATEDTLDAAVELVRREHGNLAKLSILQCTSTYPCPFEDANLLTIPWLKKTYPGATIGFSDHTQGVQAGAWAVMLGAKVVEAHVTPSRVLRGGDHKVALSLARGWWRYVRNIRNAEKALGEYGLALPESVKPARKKLERSLCAAFDLEPGTVVGSSNTVLLSPGTGIGWHDRESLFGKHVLASVEAKTMLSSTMVEAA